MEELKANRPGLNIEKFKDIIEAPLASAQAAKEAGYG